MPTSEELEKQNKLFKEQGVEAGMLDNAYKSIAATLSNMFEDVIDNLNGVDTIGAKIAKSYERDIVGSIKKMSGGLEGNLALIQKINKGQNIAKDLTSKQEQLDRRNLLTKEKINRVFGEGTDMAKKMLESLDDTYQAESNNLKSLKKTNTERQKAKSLTSILRENLEGVTDKLDKSGTLTEILKGNFEDVVTPARLTELSMAAILDAALKGSEKINTIQTTLGISYGEAQKLAGEMAITAARSEDVRVTTEGMLEAQQSINSEFQTAAALNTEMLASATSILDAQVMSAEATSQLAGDAARLGMTFDQSLQTQEDAVNAINSQTGAQISLKTVLDESNKVTGQIRAQLGANPEAIARAVTQAKALGFELEQIAASGEALLNFESSIEAELNAELLTGKQLNLEKARLAALTGDYETLTAEIASNVGDFNDFSSMNVLQQKAIAEAVGMTADQLANSLVTEENRSQLLADAAASGNDQAVNQLKAMSAAESFNKSLEKIQGVIGDIGIVFAPIIDGFAKLVSYLAESSIIARGMVGIFTLIAGIQATMAVRSLIGAYATIFKGSFMAGPLGLPLAIAGSAALGGLIAGISSMDDGVIGSDGGMVVSGPKGSIQLNKDDSIIAGTNLGGGSSGGEKFDYNKMASAMSQVQINTSIRHDSFGAKNQSANHGSYQSDAKHQTRFA
mgnify:FL=1